MINVFKDPLSKRFEVWTEDGRCIAVAETRAKALREAKKELKRDLIEISKLQTAYHTIARS